MQQLRHRTFLAVLPLLLAIPCAGHAQPVQAPTQAEAQAALNPTPFTPAQLDQILAPIALYPDQLLTELLMAATFPQQVIDAGKWLQDSNNSALTRRCAAASTVGPKPQVAGCLSANRRDDERPP